MGERCGIARGAGRGACTRNGPADTPGNGGQPVLPGRTDATHPGCAGVARGMTPMRRRKPQVTVEVKINLANCLWALAWLLSHFF